MPTTVYDSSLITQRNQAKAVSGSFINRIENANNPKTGSAPILGITDQSIINIVKNGEMKEYRKNEFGCTTINSGCPCLPAAGDQVPGAVTNVTYVYGSIIASWSLPLSGGAPTGYNVSLIPLQAFFIAPSPVVNFQNGLFFQCYTGYFGGNTQVPPGPANDNLAFFENTNPNFIENGTTSNFTTLTTATNGIYLEDDITFNFFSVQWTGYFLPPETGTYTFTLTSDDASYLWIGDQAITGFTEGNATVNNGGLHGYVSQSDTISLIKGVYYPIRVMYGESGGSNQFKLAFVKPSGGAAITSGNYFYSSRVTINGTTTNTSFTFNNNLLPTNNSYLLAVSAYNNIGTGPTVYYRQSGNIASIPTQ